MVFRQAPVASSHRSACLLASEASHGLMKRFCGLRESFFDYVPCYLGVFPHREIAQRFAQNLKHHAGVCEVII